MSATLESGQDTSSSSCAVKCNLSVTRTSILYRNSVWGMHPSQVLLAIVMATKEGVCVSACAGGGGVTMAKQESSWGRVCDCIVKQHSKGEGLNFHSTQVQTCTSMHSYISS